MIAVYLDAWSRFSRNVRLLLVVYGLFGFAYIGLYMLLFNLYLLRLGYGLEFIGLVNGTARLGFALFCLPAGILGRYWGLRPMLIAGVLLMTAGMGLVPSVEFVPQTLQRQWILITYLLIWLGFAAFFVNSQSFVMASAAPRELNHVFSSMSALMPLAGFAGNLSGGFLPGLFSSLLHFPLDSPVPYRYPLILAAALLLPALPAMMAAREVRLEPTQDETEQNDAPPFLLLFFLSFVVLLTGVADGEISAFFNVYMDDGLRASTALLGAVTAGAQLMAVPAALSMPFLVARWGHANVYFCSLIGGALSLGLMVLVPHWGPAALGRLSTAVFISINRPVFSAFHQSLVQSRWRSTMSGSTMTAFGISSAAIALGVGYLVAAWSYKALFLLGAALTALGAVVFRLFFRKPRGEHARHY